eukprot:TRINITY_DN456_c0_g2_i1.p1 TRINITY_DN456_c0_g2~~TRINITY_DN456_c0_g2_i1.p1  ORF type:complete len:172 (-),score=48.80 TRINITY_DN456_c0_g2_i1:70-585(-)
MYFFFFLMIRRPPRSTQSRSSAASDVYKRQGDACATRSSPKGEAMTVFLIGDRQIDRLGAAGVFLNFKIQSLTLGDGCQAGVLHGRNMHEDIAGSIFGRDEPVSLVGLEKFHCTRWHDWNLSLLTKPKTHSLRHLLLDTLSERHPARTGSCLLYTSPSPRDRTRSRMPSSA